MYQVFEVQKERRMAKHRRDPNRPRLLPGKKALFRGKIRAPVNITLTPEHHEKVFRNRRRLGLTRADFIGLLIEKHGDDVTV